MNAKAMKGIASVVLAACLAGSSLYAADPVGGARAGYDAITKPSKDVILSFVRPGRVVEIAVKEGDLVKEGQLVARQDDTEEQAALTMDKLKSEDVTQIEAQMAIRDQSKADYENMKGNEGASHYEIDHARLQAGVDQAKVDLAQFEHKQDGYKFQETKAAAEKTKIYSPIAGRVEEVMIKVGESVDAQNMKVMRIVNIDPLWVEVPVPFAQGRLLKKDDVALVNFSDKKTRTGHVIHVASVADSASDTLLVRVEVGNDVQMPAGERVSVSFPASGTPRVAAGQP